jgi:GT2 family glycosyltransferase
MVDIIATTRAEKIKKLSSLSSDIIEQYGMGYFLKVAIHELGKQKLNLLRPDSPPKIFLEKDMEKHAIEAYAEFFKKNKLGLTKDEIKKTIDELNYRPKFTILIDSVHFYLTADKKNIKSLLESIQKQVYTDYEIIIFSQDEIDLNESATENIADIKFISNINDLLENIHGDFVCILDKMAVLSSDALFRISTFLNNHLDSEIIYTDNDYFEKKNGNRINPFFKPDWSPYLFSCMNYFRPFCLIKTEILKKLTFNDISETLPLYDITVRATEIAKKIIHYSFPVCTVRGEYVTNVHAEEQKKIISNHFRRKKIAATVHQVLPPNTFKIEYANENEPLVSIIIPTKNNQKILHRCITSLEDNTTYKNWEIIIIDNNSTEKLTKLYYESLSYRIISYSEPFNFSKMNNLAVKHAKGDLLLFLNDDTKIIDPNSLEEMVSLCCQKDVGAVGAKLVYSDDTIQHAGVSFLKSGAGFHPFQRINEEKGGYHGIMNTVRECSAVTGACLLTKKEIFERVNQFDENFDLYYGDADLCFKIIESGYNVLYTPHAKLLHEGSYSIRKSSNLHFAIENHHHFIEKWPFLQDGDPYYNKNLGWNYSLE